MDILREVCVENFTGAIAAVQKGADRIELCDNLAVGGTTPSAGNIALSLDQISQPIAVMIRPRGGNFVYTDEEKQIMMADIAFVLEFQPHSLVVGGLTENHALDCEFLKKMRDAAPSSQLACHMCFDETPDLEESLEALIALGYDRVLTKGGERPAPDNLEALRSLVQKAAGRITVMPGSGITSANVESIAHFTGATELHGTNII